MSYVSAEEARSDLFLAGAAYVFGPLLLRLLFTLIPLNRIPIVSVVLVILLPLALTVLVPYLLIRYRKESWSQYGLGHGPSPALRTGALIAVPIAAVSVISALLAGADVVSAIPLIVLGEGALIDLLARLASWLGLVGLAVYATVKGRDAFAVDPMTVHGGMRDIGRYVAGAAAVSAVILVVASPDAQWLILPLGVAAAVALTYQRIGPRSTTSRATLLTPVVLLALGPFSLSLNALVFVSSIWEASLAAAIGLIIGALQESRGNAQGAIGLALVIAVLSQLSPAVI